MDPADAQQGLLIRNQVSSLIDSIRAIHGRAGDDIPRNLLPQIDRLYKESAKLFGNEVKRLVVEPPTRYIGRLADLMSCARSLLDFLDFKLRDPVAFRVIENGIESAKWALNQELLPYSVLICRLLKEQTMKRLCDRNGIEYPPSIQPGTLADNLRKEKGGPFEKHQWMELQSKLTYEGDVIHGKITPGRGDVSGLIDWTDRFIERWLDRDGN